MISAFSKALGLLGDPRARGVFLKSVLVATLVFALLWVLAGFGLNLLEALLADWISGGGFWSSALEWLLTGTFFVLLLVVSFVLFPTVMVTVMALFLEEVAEAVENRHYPGMEPARNPSISENVWIGVKFLGISLLLNLLALPFYLIPLVNVVVFYLLNGYLLGREYYELVSLRRLAPDRAKALRRGLRSRVFLAGVVIAFLLTLPLVNLITPIIATGFMLHVFERGRRSKQPDGIGFADGGPAQG
jgi:CysZ protein